MNRILISKDKINNYIDNNIEINGNNILFKKDGYYYIEYIECSKISLCITIDENVCVNLIEVSFDNEIEINNKYYVNGCLKLNKFFSNRSNNENIVFDLNSKGARIDYNFSNICICDEKYHIVINHNNLNTVSNINNRSIAMDNSKLNFVIDSNVSKYMNKSILNQNTRIITFGDSDCSIMPNMYIDCDDVEARHGSTIGIVNRDNIFYLMSRGINYNESLKLIIKGFLFSNISSSFDIRSRIFKIIDMYWR